MNLIAVKQKCRNSSTNSYLVAADGDLTADQILFKSGCNQNRFLLPELAKQYTCVAYIEAQICVELLIHIFFSIKVKN